jgi:hypothetical protein
VTSHELTVLQENKKKLNRATTTGTTLKLGKFKDKKNP